MKFWKCASVMALFILIAGFSHAQESDEISSNDVRNGANVSDSDKESGEPEAVTASKSVVEVTEPETKASSPESSIFNEKSAENTNLASSPVSITTVPVQVLPGKVPIYIDPAKEFCDANCVEPNCATCFGSSDICCQKCCLNIPRLRISNDFCISNCETLECKNCHDSRNPCCLNCCPSITRTRTTKTHFCTENCPTIDCNGIACPRDSKNPCCLRCCSPIPETILSGIMKDVGFCSKRCPGVDCEQCGKIQSTHFCCIDCCPSVQGALQRKDAEFLRSRIPFTRNNNNNLNSRNNNFGNMNRNVNSRGDCNN